MNTETNKQFDDVTQAILDQQRKKAEETSYETVDLTKYFTIALEDNVSRGEKVFRILPALPTEATPFMEVWFHQIEVGGNRRKLYDPGKNEGKRSPLTEVYNKLKDSKDPADKAIAAKYRPRLYYVIRGIERGKEHEGIKFW